MNRISLGWNRLHCGSIQKFPRDVNWSAYNPKRLQYLESLDRRTVLRKREVSSADEAIYGSRYQEWLERLFDYGMKYRCGGFQGPMWRDNKRCWDTMTSSTMDYSSYSTCGSTTDSATVSDSTWNG